MQASPGHRPPQRLLSRNSLSRLNPSEHWLPVTTLGESGAAPSATLRSGPQQISYSKEKWEHDDS